jgi:hypothetical protein
MMAGPPIPLLMAATHTATRRSALRVEPTQQINLALQRGRSLRLGNRLHRQNLVRKAIAE